MSEEEKSAEMVCQIVSLIGINSQEATWVWDKRKARVKPTKKKKSSRLVRKQNSIKSDINSKKSSYSLHQAKITYSDWHSSVTSC